MTATDLSRPIPPHPAREARAPAERVGRLLRALRRAQPVVPALFALLVLIAALGPLLAPYGAGETDLSRTFTPPFWQAGGSLAHLLGTDQTGQDVWSRVLIGARISLLIALVTVLLSAAIGAALGLAAGYGGGWIDTLIMRATDSMLSIPNILIALLLVSMLRPGIQSLIIAIVVFNWTRYARLVRGEVLSLRERDFVLAAVVVGAPAPRIMVTHLLPNVLNTLIVLMTLDIGRIVILESSLSFLGLGLPPGAGSWGASIAQGKTFLAIAPWVTVAPSLAMMLSILITNMFGNWMRDHFDPRLRRRA